MSDLFVSVRIASTERPQERSTMGLVNPAWAKVFARKRAGSAWRSARTQPAVFIRMAAVVRLTGLGRSTFCRLTAEKKSPSPVCLAKRTVPGAESTLTACRI